jgi:acetyltransferase-like isoleucine patch superfamily enzyme
MRFRLRRLRRCGRHVRVQGRLWVHGTGSVEVGEHTHFDGGSTGIELHTFNAARIVIGARCRFGQGVSIEACELVRLGDRVTLGNWTRILDNNFHPLQGYWLERPPSRPVIIDDDVVIGHNVIILPGVHIRPGARVADGAVVTRSIVAGAVVTGNPARRAQP